MKIRYFVLILTVVLFACNKNDAELSDFPSAIHGVWVNPIYQDQTISYQKTNELPSDEYGIWFKSDGTVVERKNAGSCGTPPIIYGDFVGSWSVVLDSLFLNVGYWGGTVDITWNIIRVNDNELVVSILDQQYHEEYR